MESEIVEHKTQAGGSYKSVWKFAQILMGSTVRRAGNCRGARLSLALNDFDYFCIFFV